VARAIVDLLDGPEASAHLQRSGIKGIERPEPSSWAPDLGAPELEIDRRSRPNGADRVERREAVGLDEIAVAEDLS
jgi:hypothetical protein